MNIVESVEVIPAIRKWKSYSACKHSGVEWLGKIPEHWNVKRLKFAAKVNMGQSPNSEEYNIAGDGLPFLQGNAEFGTVHPEPKLYCPTARKRALPGDILLSVRAPVGALNVADQEYGIGRGLCAISPDDDGLANRFTRYLLAVVRLELDIVATGSTYEAVSVDEVGSLRCVLPPLREQHTIAAFLDRETAKIDALVAKKERLIELLQEKRAAIISQAVTKGLDSNVPMKDSGIKWVGKIPAHWEVKRLKYISSILRGKFSHRPRNDPALYDGDYPFIQTGDVAASRKYITRYEQTLNEAGFAVSRQFPKGTLVMAIAANIGDLAILGFPACFPDSIVGFVPRGGVVLEYLFYDLTAMRAEMINAATENTQMNLNVDRIGALSTALPPQKEQHQIVEFLDQETSKVDDLIAKIREGIERLKEYRTALISAAVTGKIDVREEFPGNDHANASADVT